MADVTGAKIEIEYVPLGDLKPYPNNPRIAPESAITSVMTSIKKYGMKNPIVVDRNNFIIAGHTRHQALTRLGAKTVPIVRANDLEEAEAIGFRIIDNRTAELSRWDFDLLKGELQHIDLGEEVIEVSWSEMELDAIMNSSDEEAEEEEAPPSKRGGPQKKSISLELEQYEIFKKAAAVFREADPEMTDAAVLMELVGDYLNQVAEHAESA